jgi:tetratricopeptide (TPR) repeat protein
MQNRTVLCKIAAIVIVWMCGDHVIAETETIVVLGQDWGCASDEASQILQAEEIRYALGDQVQYLQTLTAVLDKNPANRLALFMRAKAEMEMGLMDKADRDLQKLEAAVGETAGLREARADYWEILGNRDKRLAALENRANKEYADPQQLARFKASIERNKAMILELRGDVAGAVAARKKILDEGDPQWRVFDVMAYARFWVRQGEYSKAADLYKGVVDLLQKQRQEGVYSWLTADYAHALWATGKRAEACSASDDSLSELISARNIDRDVIARSALALRVLSRQGGKDMDKQKADAAWPKAVELCPKGAPYSLASVVLTLDGKVPMKEEIERVEKVLKAAPNLDWALWAAMYLYLSGTEEARPLAKYLPEKSIQRRIVEVEEKAASSVGKPFPPAPASPPSAGGLVIPEG